MAAVAPGSKWAVNQRGPCGLKVGKSGESKRGYGGVEGGSKNYGLTVFVDQASNFPYKSKTSVKSVALTLL